MYMVYFYYNCEKGRLFHWFALLMCGHISKLSADFSSKLCMYILMYTWYLINIMRNQGNP